MSTMLVGHPDQIAMRQRCGRNKWLNVLRLRVEADSDGTDGSLSPSPDRRLNDFVKNVNDGGDVGYCIVSEGDRLINMMRRKNAVVGHNVGYFATRAV
jgi:hypothetical protein